jgi:glutamate synthase domain-containing protein 1
MPSKSKKQHNFMEAIAHSPSFAKKAGVPQSVGKEFAKADKGRTFAKGGDMKSKKMAMGGMASQAPAAAQVGAAMDPKKAAMIAQAMKNRPRMAAPAPQMAAPAPQMAAPSAAPGMKKGGFVRSADGIAKKGKTRGKII